MKSYKKMNSAILSQVTMISTEKLVNLIRGARLEKVALDSTQNFQNDKNDILFLIIFIKLIIVTNCEKCGLYFSDLT